MVSSDLEVYLRSRKLDMSRIPNMQRINATFRKQWWDPTEEYAVPKDYGTTGMAKFSAGC